MKRGMRTPTEAALYQMIFGPEKKAVKAVKAMIVSPGGTTYKSKAAAARRKKTVNKKKAASAKTARRSPLSMMLRSGRVVGSVRWTHSENCRLSRLQRWTLLPAVLLGFGSAGWRMNAWLRIWNDHDNQMPHLHLGPLGVDPSVQGMGLGSVLMQAYCEALAERRLPGYLETERLSNVYFYQRFGFAVTDEVPVLDVPTWLMLKPYRL